MAVIYQEAESVIRIAWMNMMGATAEDAASWQEFPVHS